MSLLEVEIIDTLEIEEIYKMAEKFKEAKTNNTDKFEKYSLRDLTDLEEDKVSRYFCNRAYEAREALQLIRKIRLPIFIITLLIIIILSVAGIIKTDIDSLATMGFTDKTSTIVSIHMNSENKLEYNLESIVLNTDKHKIKLGNFSWVRGNIDSDNNSYLINGTEHSISNETSLDAFNIKDKYVYITYSNKENTANKELLVAATKPTDLNIEGLNKKHVRFKEKSNPIQVTTTANSYNDIFIMMNESLAGGELNVDSFKQNIIQFESRMLSAKEYEGIKLSLAGIGYIDLSKLESVSESPELSYNRVDDVLQIRNSADNITYMYISSINNEYIGCNAEDLIATDKDNLYIHYNFDKPDKVGYKTFAIMADNNLYCIKLNELASEAMQNNLFKQLGINDNSIEIKKIQRVVDN